jgi:hypothetical protein
LIEPTALKIWRVLAARGDEDATARLQVTAERRRQNRLLAARKPDTILLSEWKAIIKLAGKGNAEAKALIAESARPTWEQCLQLLAKNGDGKAASALKDLKDQKQRKRDLDEDEGESPPSGEAAGAEGIASSAGVKTANIDEKFDLTGEDDDQSAVRKVQTSTTAYSNGNASGTGGSMPTGDDKLQRLGQPQPAPSDLRRDSVMSQNNNATAGQDVGVDFNEPLVETKEQQLAREDKDLGLENDGAPHKKQRTSL